MAMSAIKDSSELGCASAPFTWVHRSDGSGNTKAFTSSMAAFSSAWTIGTGKAVNWPRGVGAKGNDGVAAVIKKREGAIGYLNQAYIRGSIKAAALQNLAGEFVKPSDEAGAIALNQITLDQNLAGENPNPSAASAYPIATLTRVLAYKRVNGPDAAIIKDAFNFMLSDEAQNVAPRLGFVPLRGDILVIKCLSEQYLRVISTGF